MSFEDALRETAGVLAMTFNPEVEMQRRKMEYQKRQDALAQLSQGIESGAIDPTVGNQRIQQLGGQPVGPNQLTLDRQQQLKDKQEAMAREERIRQGMSPIVQKLQAGELTPEQAQYAALQLQSSEGQASKTLETIAKPNVRMVQDAQGNYVQVTQPSVGAPTVKQTGVKGQPKGAGGGAGWQNLEPSEDELEGSMYAYLIKNTPPARGSKLYARTMGSIAQLAKDNNMSVRDIMAASADVKSQLLAKTQLEKRIQNMDRAETQIEKEIPTLERAMKLVDAPDSPWPARLSMSAVRNGVGTDSQRAAVAQLDQSASVILNEFQGVVAGNPGGALHVSDIEQAKADYLKLSAPTEMKAWISNARNIISRAKEAGKETRKNIMSGVKETIPNKGGSTKKEDPLGIR